MLDIFSTLCLRVTPTETLTISSRLEDNRIYECAAAALPGNTKHFPKPHKTTKIVTARQLVELLAAGPGPP